MFFAQSAGTDSSHISSFQVPITNSYTWANNGIFAILFIAACLAIVSTFFRS